MAYTVEELRTKIEKTKKNPMLTDGQKSQLLEKYNKDIEAIEGETESEDWMEELEELLSEGENPEATKIYNGLSKEKKEKYLDFRHDRFTDFSEMSNWDDGVAPTKEEVKKDLLRLIKLGEVEKKERKPMIIAVKGSSGKGKSYTPSREECEEIIKEASIKAKKAKVSAAKSAKKSPVVKNKEKIEKVEESVMERVESGKATKAEILSMIARLQEVLKKLNKALDNIKK